ncbi:unnamed protein product [Macrosiphum euphorbiae]|uniref:Uncharacterized protein n=1 Tax=Macrosiphum euphorbiae TaxID=13131 RepID=A0AAV0WCM2_9HEMI|nr:unnamed protein product [Macrosiphum euphorbiae]
MKLTSRLRELKSCEQFRGVIVGWLDPEAIHYSGQRAPAQCRRSSFSSMRRQVKRVCFAEHHSRRRFRGKDDGCATGPEDEEKQHSACSPDILRPLGCSFDDDG